MTALANEVVLRVLKDACNHARKSETYRIIRQELRGPLTAISPAEPRDIDQRKERGDFRT